MQERTIESRAAATGAIMLAAAVLAAGCNAAGTPPEVTVDAAPAPGDFAVRGNAVGLLGPLEIELHRGDEREALTLNADGAFAFETRLADGTSYAVVLPDVNAPWGVSNAQGQIAGADVDVELSCTGPALARLVVSGVASAVTLVPDTTEYTVDLPPEQAAATLTANVADAGDTLTIDGVDGASGAPSAEITLEPGDNYVDIVVENELGWQREYRVNLRRAADPAP